MIDTWPHEIQAFETSDGNIYRSLDIAQAHQKRIDGAVIATKALRDGQSLGASMRAGGFLAVGILPELDSIFASTKLVISHWQCRDQPGYSPIDVRPDGLVRVFGDAGSWSGPYGNWCSLHEIAEYWHWQRRRSEVGS